MRILLLAPDAARPNGEGSYTYHNIRAPLLDLGHDILDVDYRDEIRCHGRDGMNRRLLEQVKREQPELLLHMIFEDELADEVADEIAANTATTSVAFFSDDDWRLDHSLRSIPHYNVGVTTTPEAVDVFRAKGHEQVVLTQWGCNPAQYYPIEGRPKRYDVSFVGQAYKGRPELIGWLKACGIEVRVWGQGWERIPVLREQAGGQLPHRDMLEVFADSKIVLGMAWCSSDGVTPQIKGRTFEYPACKAFQLTNEDRRLDAFFRDGEEIVRYRDRADLREKIRYYLAHDAERTAIAEAAYRRVLAEHTWTHRLKTVLAQIEERRPARKRLLSPTGGRAARRIEQSAEARHRPTVSVVTYAYNVERYIGAFVESVLAQTYEDFELLVLDDGSTDGTAEVVKRYATDRRLRYVYQENIGKTMLAFDRLLNRSAALTTGEFFCASGSDDVFLPDKLEKQVRAFREDPSLDIVFCDGYHMDAEGRLKPTDFRFPEARAFAPHTLLRTLFKKNIVAHPAVMMTRASIERMGGFEDGFAPDYQFWLKAAPYCRFRYLDEKLFQYRIHERGASTGTNNKTVPETVKLLAEMRRRFSIADFYPELRDCADRQQALYSAYLQLGDLFLTANIPVPALAVQEYLRAREHGPNGIEAVNNLAVALWLAGSTEQSVKCWQALAAVGAGHDTVAHNLRLVEEALRGGRREEPRFRLIQEAAGDSELVRRLGGEDRGARPDDRRQERSDEHPRETRAVPDRKPAPAAAHSASAAEATDRPLVSVVMATYNRPDQLVEAVRSVLAQTYRRFELIVVNDAGEDVEGRLSGLDPDRRITYVRHGKNRGLAAARNTALRLAKGTYIAYLDDDDRYYPEHLETLVTFLERGTHRAAYTDAHRATQMRRGDRYVTVKQDLPYSCDFDRRVLLVENFFPVLCVMHERACLDEAGLFDESLTSHEDWDLWIRLSRTAPFGHIARATAEFAWRTDGTTMTSGSRPDYARTMEVIHRRYAEEAAAMPGVAIAQRRHIEALKMKLAYPDVDCSIVIPVWNKLELTKQCLAALARHTSGASFEVIVVDNGSTDGTPEWLGTLRGNVRVIRNETNLGFAKACNQGARAARGRYVLFLNNDTVPLEGWLVPLVEELEYKPHVTVVGSKLLYADGTIQHAGVVFSKVFLTPYHLYQHSRGDLPAANRRREFQALTAACLMVRREAFEAVGGFDEGYLNGFEDVDLCLKIRERGGQVVYLPKSVLYHLESQTPGRNANDSANGRRFLERWGASWLEDEDEHYLADGYGNEVSIEQGVVVANPRPFATEDARRRWGLVADVQRLARAGDWEAADALLNDEALWPDDFWALQWAGKVCAWRKRTDRAAAFWTRALAMQENSGIRAELAKIALERGEVEAAREQLARVDEAHGEGWFLRGVLAMQQPDCAAAVDLFERALACGCDRRKGRLGLVMACLGAGEASRATDVCAELMAEWPDDAEVLHWLLRAGSASERWAELAERFGSFLARNPAEMHTRFAYAGILLRVGRGEEARREYEQIRLFAPDFDGLADLARAIEAAAAPAGVSA